jgi:ribosomal protein L31E
MSLDEPGVVCRTYRRPNCVIEITKEAERLLNYDNVNIDSFANHLYLFAKSQDFMGNDKIRVRVGNGNEAVWVGFLWRKKDIESILGGKGLEVSR